MDVFKILISFFEEYEKKDKDWVYLNLILSRNPYIQQFIDAKVKLTNIRSCKESKYPYVKLSNLVKDNCPAMRRLIRKELESRLELGKIYTFKFLKQLFREIYVKYGVTKTPKASEIKFYYKVVLGVLFVDGVKHKTYTLIYQLDSF